MNLKKRVTIKQVAKESGVSVQTVSRAINNHPDVSKETRRRVQQVARRLAFHPNNIARALIQGRSSTLGVVGTGLEYYGPSRTLAGIEKQADELGYVPLLSLVRQPDQSDVERIVHELVSRQVDGIIWAVPEIGCNRDWIVREVSQLPFPVVFLNMHSRPDLSVVAVDNQAGGRVATNHLLAQGYRRIGLVTGPLSWWEARQRKLGWQEAIQHAGLTVDAAAIAEGDWTAASGELALRQLLERCPELDAVFFSNDQMALGALRSAARLGRRVPEDMGVVGFDNIPESAYFQPPLTTVRQDTDELGSTAVRELTRLIESVHQENSILEPRTILLGTHLVVRDSSPTRAKV